MRVCQHCGDSFSYAVAAPGDFERTFDFQAEWQGIRLLCPGCGEVQRVSFAPVTLTNAAPARLPPGMRVHAVVGTGPEIVPLPARGA